MEYNNVTFDDVVVEHKSIWSQVCQSCSAKHFELELLEDIPISSLICGVENCQKEADFYIDFDYEKKLD